MASLTPLLLDEVHVLALVTTVRIIPVSGNIKILTFEYWIAMTGQLAEGDWMSVPRRHDN
eukprot:scaffold818_cov136-Cylindrotheca_fusiformis.AAC.55